MLNVETLQNIVEFIGSLSFVVIIYFGLNYLMNANVEEKKLKIYGYNMKSINYILILMSFSFVVIQSLIFIMYKYLFLNQSDIYNQNIKNNIYIIMIISIIIFILGGLYFLIQKQLSTFFLFLTIIISIIGGHILYCSWCSLPDKTYLSLIITIDMMIFLLIVISYGCLSSKYNIYTQEIEFRKETSCKKIIGTIISETNDDIIFETDGILHRYRKSDIFCIKEYKTSNIKS